MPATRTRAVPASALRSPATSPAPMAATSPSATARWADCGRRSGCRCEVLVGPMERSAVRDSFTACTSPGLLRSIRATHPSRHDRACPGLTAYVSAVFRKSLRRLLRHHGLQLFHVLDVHGPAAGHDDVAGLLVGLAGAEPFGFDGRRRITRHAAGAALAVRGRLHGIGRIEVTGDFGMRGDRHAGDAADTVADIAGRSLLDVLPGADIL